MTRVESFNNFGPENFEILSVERAAAFNSNYPTRIAPENGNFGRIEGLSPIIQRQFGWSSNITDFISSPAEARIYRGARLMEAEIGGKRALIRNDINWHRVDEFGRTNLQRIENNLSPINNNNQTIELHHAGQKRNSPLVELTAEQHRSPGNSRILHPEGSSDVHGEGNNWQAEKKQYWKDRADADLTRRQIVSQTAKKAHIDGLQGGLVAAGIVGAITTVDNVRGVFNGDISAQEAAVNIAIDAGSAAALGYGTTFISSAVTNLTQKSAHTAIRTLGGAGLPAAAVSLAVISYDSVVNFAQGNICGTELAQDLAENATGVAGAIAGAAIGGTALGIPGALVGGMVGYLIAVEAYATVIDAINNGVGVLADRAVDMLETAADLRDKAIEMGQAVLDYVATVAADALDSIRTSLSDFASNLSVSLSFR